MKLMNKIDTMYKEMSEIRPTFEHGCSDDVTLNLRISVAKADRPQIIPLPLVVSRIDNEHQRYSNSLLLSSAIPLHGAHTTVEKIH